MTRLNANIKPLIHIVKLRHQRTRMHLEQLRAEENELYAALSSLAYKLEQNKRNMVLYRKSAYLEKLCSRVSVEDVEMINYKLKSMEKIIEDVVMQQKNISSEIEGLQVKIAQVKQQLRFFSVKEEKYLYLLGDQA